MGIIPTDVKEKYFKDGEKEFNQDKWHSEGKPICWYKVYDKDNIIVYEDRAYGLIQLVTPQGTDTGLNLAHTNDIVVFGPYYEGTLKINRPYRLM